MKRSTDSTGRTGVHAVALIFSRKLGWIFREQHESNYGIDAQVELKMGDNYVYRGGKSAPAEKANTLVVLIGLVVFSTIASNLRRRVHEPVSPACQIWST